MLTTTTLREEHQTIRQWLDRLEVLLPVAPERRLPLVYTLRKITDRLAAHLAHEAEVYGRLGQEVWQPAAPATAIRHDHEDVTTTLNIIDGLLAKGHGASLESLGAYISHLLDTLREHMAEEEATLFPLIDRALAERLPDAVTPSTEPSSPSIAGMTVNRILRTYPQTDPIFRRFRINREEHGCESLDEAAWYCGVCMRDIERALRATIERRLAATASL